MDPEPDPGVSPAPDFDQPVGVTDAARHVGCGEHELVSFVGGGGKTTLLHALAHGLPGTRIATTTTKMSSAESGDLRTLIGASDGEIAAAAAKGPVLAWRSVSGGKGVGLDPSRCNALFGRVDHVIVEADGARSMPFKAPGPFEPRVPSSTTIMVSVIGADALGRVIADQCHRPLRVAALAGCGPYGRLAPEAAATVLLHPRGQRAALPDGGRFVIAITKVDAANIGFVRTLMAEVARLEPAILAIPIARFAGTR